MRALGIDFGTVRIGLALCDPLGILASPQPIYERKHYKKDVEFVAQLASKNAVEVIVLGLPMHMNGDESDKAREVKEFAASLEKYSAAKIEFIDERLTSVQGERLMAESGSKKKYVDSVCAAIILQTFLDKKRRN